MKRIIQRSNPCAYAALMLVQAFVWNAPAYAENTSSIQRDFFSPNSTEDTFFSTANNKKFHAFYNGKALGEIHVFHNLNQALIPAASLFSLLNWNITLDQDNQVARGYMPGTDKRVMIAPVIRTIMVGERNFTFDKSQIAYYQNDIYLDSNIPRDVFGLDIVIDQNRNLIKISYTPETVASDINEEETDDEPKEAAQTPSPEIPDQEIIQQAWPNTGSDEDEIIVLQLIINDILMADFVEVIIRDGKRFLPFSGISQILEFPIKTDINHLKADGWFIREKNTVHIDGMSAAIKGKSYPLDDTVLIKNEEDFYIEENLLAEWLGINFAIEVHDMSLAVNSESPFPFEERMEREKLYTTLERRKNQQEKERNYTPYDLPYEAFSPPVLDFNLTSAYDKLSRNKYSSVYNIQGGGDLGYLSSQLYASGDLNNESLQDFRLSLGRDDYKKDLLGFLHASSFRFGDVNSIGISQVTQVSEGRGITVTNRDLARTDKFDVTSFSGDSTPGWDVELYRNGTLVDAQTVDTDGRYEFNDVPILFGNNTFRVLLLGPQGQIEEKVKNINASNSILDQGQFTYNVSADQKSKRIVEFRDIEPSHPDGLRLAGEAEYGITKWMTGVLGSAQTQLSDGEHRYISGGVKTTFFGILASLDHAYDITSQGRSTRFTGFANYSGLNIRLSHRFAKNFASEEESSISNPVERDTNLDLDRSFSFPILGELGLGLFLQNKTHEFGVNEKTIRGRFNKNFKGFNITGTLEKNISAEDRLFGSLQARGLLGKNVLTLSTDYNLRPYQELSQVKMSWLRSLSPSVLNNLSVTRRYSDSATYELENTVTFDMKKYKFYITGRTDNEQSHYAGIGLNFSLGEYPHKGWTFSSRPRSSSGIAVAQAYIDQNYNLKKDSNEKPAENVFLKIGSRTYQTDEYGVTVAENLETQSPVYIHADQKKFTDQAMGPGVEGYAVDLRPGYAASVDYPIFLTSEIEGIVEFPESVGIPKDMQISLVNLEGQVISTTKCEFDGYFLFRNILPGTYFVKIPEEVLNSKKLKYADDSPVIVGNDDDFVVITIPIVSVTSHNVENRTETSEEILVP